MSQRQGPPKSDTSSQKQLKRAELKKARESLATIPVDLAGNRVAASMRRAVRNAKARGDVQNVFYLTASEIVISECMRLSPSSTTSDPFFERPSPQGIITWRYQSRITAIADTLYALRNIGGFDLFCRRLLDQEVRSSFYEGFAARMFLELGYQIRVRPSTGVKGQDFDFIATKNDLTVNGEVTTLQGASYSSDSVGNSLEQKRKQVPPNEPNVVFLVPPESWYTPGYKLVAEAIRADVGDFCASSQRFNAIVVISEDHVDHGFQDRGWLGFRFDPILHANPRIPVAELDDFFDKLDTDVKPDQQRLKDMALISTDHVSEFFEWADSFWNEPL